MILTNVYFPVFAVADTVLAVDGRGGGTRSEVTPMEDVEAVDGFAVTETVLTVDAVDAFAVTDTGLTVDDVDGFAVTDTVLTVDAVDGFAVTDTVLDVDDSGGGADSEVAPTEDAEAVGDVDGLAVVLDTLVELVPADKVDDKVEDACCVDDWLTCLVDGGGIVVVAVDTFVLLVEVVVVPAVVMVELALELRVKVMGAKVGGVEAGAGIVAGFVVFAPRLVQHSGAPGRDHSPFSWHSLRKSPGRGSFPDLQKNITWS